MAATVTISRGNTLPDTAAKGDFHNLIDQATGTVTGIANGDVASDAAIDSSKLALTTISQTMSHSSVAVNWAKGSDIASSGTTNIAGATGNYVHITGTTTITAFGTAQAGTWRSVRFAGILTLTHNSTSLILPTGANITTAAGDTAIFISEGSGNWRCVSYQRADGTSLAGVFTPSASNALAGSVVQTVYTISSAVATGTTTTPIDDTIPQNTEGDQYITQAITPNSATNLLMIEFTGLFGNSVSDSKLVCALHQDSTANALASTMDITAENGGCYVVKLSWIMVSGTTSSTTLKIRVGANTASTTTFNGFGGARKLGGVAASVLRIQEIKV